MENVASGNEWVPFQVGRFGGPDERVEAPTVDDAGPTVVENIRTGDARVGAQVDQWEGDLHIDMP